MNKFEKDFEEKFSLIRKRTGAFLYRLYPPMRVGGMRGSMPCWIQVGRALFDVAGWTPIRAEVQGDNGLQSEHPVARAIGIELKETKDAKSSMRIVGEDGSGSGIQAHQLEALAAVHRDGGIARVLWNNGGIVAVLDGDEIAQAHFTYGVSVQAEKMRKTPSLGSRSIPWRLFRQVNFEDHPEQIVLTPKKEPTLAEELKAKRKKTARRIQESSDDPVDPEVFNVEN